MHPLRFPLLADENVAPGVIAGLRARGCDVVGVMERGLVGQGDTIILGVAHAEGRVVVTHDGDFGTLAIRAGQPLIGVLYLRPGHIDAREVLRQVDAVLGLEVDAHPPFVLVAARRGDEVRVRLRRLTIRGG